MDNCRKKDEEAVVSRCPNQILCSVGTIISDAMNKESHAELGNGQDTGRRVLLQGFECVIEDGASEGGEQGIAASYAGNGVDGGLRVGMCAARVRELGAKAGAVVGKKCASFVRGVIVGDMIELAMETLL